MARPTVHQLVNNAAITTSGQFPSAAGVENRATEGEPGSTVAVDIFTGAATGTTPSLTVSIEVSVDGTNWVQVATGTAITTSNQKQRVAVNNIVEPWVRAVFTVTGTTPSFAASTVYLIIG